MQLKNQRSRSNTVCDFERNYDVLKSKSPRILLSKNINFNKNETESKAENPTHSFRDMNLVFQLTWESQIKRKTVMSWSSRKKKRGIFFPSERNFNICVLSQCIMYWIRFENIHTFTYLAGFWIPLYQSHSGVLKQKVTSISPYHVHTWDALQPY